MLLKISITSLAGVCQALHNQLVLMHIAFPATYMKIKEHLANFVIDICNFQVKNSAEHLKRVVVDMHSITNLLQASFSDANIGTVTSAVGVTLDELLKVLEVAFDAAMTVLGPRAGLSPTQVAQAEADFQALVATIEGLEHRDIEAQTGAEEIVRDVTMLLKDLGVDPHIPTSDTPTALDAALEALRAALDAALEVWGPLHNQNAYTISELEADLTGLEADIKDIEHGRMELTDGLVRIVDDVFNMLRDFGVPVLDIGAAVGITDKAGGLRTQLETILDVVHSRRSQPAPSPAPAQASIRKLELHLVAFGTGYDRVTLFEVVHDMTQVARRFLDMLG